MLTDLTLIGTQKRDLDQVVHYGAQALAVAQQTGSGVLARKLSGLRVHLEPLQGIGAVRQLNTEIAALTRRSPTKFEE